MYRQTFEILKSTYSNTHIQNINRQKTMEHLIYTGYTEFHKEYLNY